MAAKEFASGAAIPNYLARDFLTCMRIITSQSEFIQPTQVRIKGLEPELSMSIFDENELRPKNYSLSWCAAIPKLALSHRHRKHVKLSIRFWLCPSFRFWLETLNAFYRKL